MSTCSTIIKRVGKKPLLSAATNNNIPEDVLLSNIFIRLRAKQLARMRSLSKSWNDLLSHPSFIQSHLDRSNNSNDDEILMVFHNEAFSIMNPFTVHPSGSPGEDLTNLIKLPVNTLRGYDSVIIGSVNGLICFFSTDEIDPPTFHIWNPSLSALMTLPDIDDHIYDIDYDLYDYCFRFGHDPKTSDYKVVKIAFTHCHVLNGMIQDFLPIEVYSMRRNSWKFITERFPSHIKYIHHFNDEVYVDGYDGYVHWLCSIDTKYMHETIMTFDLNLETLSEIHLPDSIQSNRRNNLGVWSRKLCVISCIDDGDCEVWVMDKYKVASSWMKLHVLSGFTGNIHPIGFTLNNKFLLEHSFRLALYNPNAAASKLFKAVESVDLSIKVALYIDSLVWPVARKVRHQL